MQSLKKMWEATAGNSGFITIEGLGIQLIYRKWIPQPLSRSLNQNFQGWGRGINVFIMFPGNSDS